MTDERQEAPSTPGRDMDPLLCDQRIAHEYAIFQFNTLATTIAGEAQQALQNPTYESLKRSAQVSVDFGNKVADMARSLMAFSRAPVEASAPRLADPLDVAHAPPAPVSRAARVLVVDDEAVIRAIFSRFITRAGHHVDAAAGGREALEKIQANLFDVVLLDWMMPEVAGVDVLREVQRVKPELPCIIVTAAYSHRVAAEAIEAGARECIGKPLNHRKVLYLIDKYSGAHAHHFDSPEETGLRAQGEVLLVAEPDALTRDLYHLVFDHAGYENHMVASYEEACAALAKEYYDAILLHGALVQGDTLGRIRAIRRLNPYTPILVVGESARDQALSKSLSAGASAVIERPIEANRFLSKLRAILDLYKEPSASRFRA